MPPSTPTLFPNRHPLRLILPVAPQALARGRFAPLEKAPTALSPAAALAWLDEHQGQGLAVAGVELAGPGDPLATPGPTLETLNLVRQRYPGLALTVTTLGIHGHREVKALAEHGVSQLTLMVEAVNVEVAKEVYAWIRPGKCTVPLAQAAGILLQEQATCLAACLQAGIAVTIRTVVQPGINDRHVEAIADQMAALGATAMIILPGPPRSDGERIIPAPSLERMRDLRAAAGRHLPILEAPAAALDPAIPPAASASLRPRPSRSRPNVAVVSGDGLAVDRHLGQASRVLIYGPREDGLVALLASRSLPTAGGGAGRWQALAGLLPDCFALLAASAGDTPRAALQGHGITVLTTEGEVEGAVDHLYAAGKPRRRE